MKIIDKMCGKIGLLDEEDDGQDLEIEQKVKTMNSYDGSNNTDNGMSSGNVVNFHSNASRENVTAVNNVMKMKVMVIEPKKFDDAQQVANCLREKRPVVVNFEGTDAEDAKRIIDFISGTTYALNGEIQKVGQNVFLCAPSNVNVSFSEEEKKATADMPWLKK